ncbi:ABC transporter [Colletotrichum tofieldiae]|nr:ABC transporter [Colletotrichum tofieldiae]
MVDHLRHGTRNSYGRTSRWSSRILSVALVQLVTADVVRAACDISLLQSTISFLPFVMDTRIGPTGNRLSNEQIRVLALARARLRDPSILILDEAMNGKLLVLDEELRRRSLSYMMSPRLHKMITSTSWTMAVLSKKAPVI